MVGEIRDVETAKISIEAALTGHFVLSTLHTNDAPAALSRLNEMGVEPFLTGAAVTGVLAQRLARRLCEHCKETLHADEGRTHRRRASPRSSGTARSSSSGATVAAVAGRPATAAGSAIFQLLAMNEELSALAARKRATTSSNALRSKRA